MTLLILGLRNEDHLLFGEDNDSTQAALHMQDTAAQDLLHADCLANLGGNGDFGKEALDIAAQNSASSDSLPNHGSDDDFGQAAAGTDVEAASDID